MMVVSVVSPTGIRVVSIHLHLVISTMASLVSSHYKNVLARHMLSMNGSR
jgi:hypothetical protein